MVGKNHISASPKTDPFYCSTFVLYLQWIKIVKGLLCLPVVTRFVKLRYTWLGQAGGPCVRRLPDFG